MSSAMLVLLALVVPSVPQDEEAALAHRAANFRPVDYPYIYYVSTAAGHPGKPGHPEEAEQRKQEIAMRLVMASTTRQVVLERCVPEPVKDHPTLFWFDIRNFYWPLDAWRRFIANYPYAATTWPLVLRADWLVVHLADANEQQTPAYYELLFGKVPKTRDEALKILRVDLDPNQQFGLIAAQSTVSVAGTRWIANLPVGRGYAWGTNDALVLDREHDMLERPDGTFKHDGEEWIIGLWKKELKSGTIGALQGYFLADGQGKIIKRADIRLVRDGTHFRGLDEIRIAGSCIQCHTGGLNKPREDALRSLFEVGVTRETYDFRVKDKIEQFHFNDVATPIDRANEDYGKIVGLLCGVPPATAAAAFAATVRAYDRPVAPARAAWELGIDRGDLRLALAYGTGRGAQLPARIAGLALGLDAPRAAFEPAYIDLHYRLIPDWEKSSKWNVQPHTQSQLPWRPPATRPAGGSATRANSRPWSITTPPPRTSSHISRITR